MAKKILVIDDNPQLRTMIKAYLTQEGFEICTAANGQEGLFVARREKPNLVILDLMMPEMGGYEFMKIFSRESDTPVIILTARIEEQDKVLGLELGADDYVTKPFSPRELTARVRAVMRRMEKQASSNHEILRVSDVVLDPDQHIVSVAGAVVNLTPSEFELLTILMTTPGRVFSRAELLDHLQGVAYEGYERSIDVHIRNLRTKIEPDSSNPRYVETVYGAGYRFVASH
jgi:DNA-binding response OmpR family regulator